MILLLHMIMVRMVDIYMVYRFTLIGTLWRVRCSWISMKWMWRMMLSLCLI